MKVFVFYGCLNQFKNYLPDADIPTIVDLACSLDRSRGKLMLDLGELTRKKENTEPEPLPYYKDVVAFSDDYPALGEHVIESFVSFLFQHDIDNLYLQNPPDSIANHLKELSSTDYEEKHQDYKTLCMEQLQTMKKEFPNTILGQDHALAELLGTLYDVVKGRYQKPCVLLLYGSTGVGKTETAKYLSQLLEEPLFRKQFSMLHSEEFTSYLFGGKHSQNSFAKELLERESNVILLDEFDKPNPVFYSAFYQLFDEGIFVDKNYTVKMKDSIIICTSNFLSEKQIKERLGDPIYSRFDAVIRYDDLPADAIIELLSREFEKQFNVLDKEEQEIIKHDDLKNKLLGFISRLHNARQIKRFVREAISGTLVNHLL